MFEYRPFSLGFTVFNKKRVTFLAHVMKNNFCYLPNFSLFPTRLAWFQKKKFNEHLNPDI